jgi:hypothetical protein
MSKKDSRQQMMMAAVAVNTAINAADCLGLLPLRGSKLNVSGTATVGCLETHEISLHSKQEKALQIKEGTTEYMRFDTKNKKVVIFKDSEQTGNQAITGGLTVKAARGVAGDADIAGKMKSGSVETGTATIAKADITEFTTAPSFRNADGLTVENTANDAKGGVITMRNTRGGSDKDGVAADVLGEIRFFGNDDAANATTSAKANDTEYATIQGSISDASNPNGEEGKLSLQVAHAGAAPVDVLTITGAAAGAASSTTSVAGHLEITGEHRAPILKAPVENGDAALTVTEVLHAGTIIMQTDVSADKTHTVPAPSQAGVQYRFVGQGEGSSADGHDIIFDCGGVFLDGAITFVDTDTNAGSTGVWANGTTNDTLQINLPQHYDITLIAKSTTVWYVTGVVTSTAAPAFSG